MRTAKCLYQDPPQQFATIPYTMIVLKSVNLANRTVDVQMHVLIREDPLYSTCINHQLTRGLDLPNI